LIRQKKFDYSVLSRVEDAAVSEDISPALAAVGGVAE
jgi:hypothetical protein